MTEGDRRIDLHTHSVLSDGALLPSELLRRATALGYGALAITDHVDAGNVGRVIEALCLLREAQKGDFLPFIIGVEITHVAPRSIARLARRAKELGAELIVVHGETPVEPVAPGTNRAAVDCEDVDILAHPGFLRREEALRAASRGCYIEITTRYGHCLTNGHVATICAEVGAPMLVNSDCHEPSDLVSMGFARQVARGSGLPEALVRAAIEDNPTALVRRILPRTGL